MQAAVYTRVSTDEQKNNFSLRSQLRTCMDYITQNGHVFYKEYQDDGYSGSSLDRPAIQQLIKDIESKAVDILVFLCLDRLTRNPKDIQFFIELVDKTNVGFISVQERFDTTSSFGIFQLHQMAAIAQLERQNITERLMRGKEQKAREGNLMGSVAPYGYQFNSKGKMIIDDEEAEIVQWIFKTYLKYGLITICRKLNERGLKTRRGAFWQEGTARYILTNPVYIGKLRWAHRSKKDCIIRQGKHTPIIDTKTFDTVQELLKKRHFNKRGLTSNYIYGGILKCNRCGAPLFGNRYKKKDGSYSYSYTCSNKSRGACDMPSIAEDIIEKAMLELNLITKKNGNSNLETTNKLKEIEKSIEINMQGIEKIKNRRKKWHINHADSLIDDVEYKELILESKRKEKSLNTEIEMLSKELNRKSNYSIEEFLAEFAEIKKMWSHLTRAEKKEISITIFQKIIIDCPLKSVKPAPGRKAPCNIITFSVN